MTSERSVKQFIFQRGRVDTPSQVIEDDRAVVRNIADKLLARSLDRRLNPDLTYYARTVNELYAGLVERGDISDAEKVKQIAGSAVTAAGLYWGGYLEVPVQVLNADDMLDAENEYADRLNRELGAVKANRFKLPSPSFIDQMEGKIIVSDKYVFLHPKPGSRQNRSVYVTGEADAKFYPWDKDALMAQATGDAGNLIMRHNRGETGDNYLAMLKDFPGSIINGVNHAISAVNSYTLPKILKTGGIPVLYRRATDIFRDPQTQKFYVAIKALADDMGAETASLFDAVDIQPSQRGTLVIGYLWGSHPNNAYKERKIMEAVAKLNYQTQITEIPESVFKLLL